MCLFCKIANKEIEAEIILETDSAVVILDIHPVSKGHSMVIPKFHAENILEAEDEDIKEVFLAVKKTVALLKKTLDPDGFTIGVNHGKVSGQEIDHLHIHVVPRWRSDGGKSLHSVVHNPPLESVEEIAKTIRERA